MYQCWGLPKESRLLVRLHNAETGTYRSSTGFEAYLRVSLFGPESCASGPLQGVLQHPAPQPQPARLPQEVCNLVMNRIQLSLHRVKKIVCCSALIPPKRQGSLQPRGECPKKRGQFYALAAECSSMAKTCAHYLIQCSHYAANMYTNSMIEVHPIGIQTHNEKLPMHDHGRIYMSESLT